MLVRKVITLLIQPSTDQYLRISNYNKHIKIMMLGTTLEIIKEALKDGEEITVIEFGFARSKSIYER